MYISYIKMLKNNNAKKKKTGKYTYRDLWDILKALLSGRDE